MSRYKAFSDAFGKPMEGTAAMGETAGLPDLAAFADAIGGGVFAEGFLSVLSVRERACRPNPWLGPLPEGTFHVATSAFGCLLAADGKQAFAIDVLLGNVMRTELSIGDALLRLAEAESCDDMLNQPLFEQWREVTGGSLEADKVLIPAPLPVLGGELALDTIRPVDAAVAMSLTFQSYDGRFGEQVRTF